MTLFGDGSLSRSSRLVARRWRRARESSASKRRRRDLLPATAMSTLLVRVSIGGFSPVCSEGDLSSLMWGGASNSAGFWNEMSFGKLVFLSDLDENGAPDVTSVALESAPASCEEVWPAVLAKLTANNMQPSRWQRHVLMLPKDFTACGWATASIGCDLLEGCRLHLTACTDFPDSLIHELGHTLGLHHGAGYTETGAIDDYEDRT